MWGDRSCTWCMWPSARPFLIENCTENLCRECIEIAQRWGLVSIRLTDEEERHDLAA